jgi:hypothetical protein
VLFHASSFSICITISRSVPRRIPQPEVPLGFISDLLTRKQTIEQGRQLASQFAKRIPVEKVSDEKRVAAEYDILKANAVGYQRRANLGVYGKSQLVNSIQWALIASGYPETFSKEIGGELAVTLAASR